MVQDVWVLPKIKAMVFSLVENTSEGILLHIAPNCGFNNRIKTEELQEFIVELNTKILDSCSLEVKHTASHHFLFNLIRHNISLYPRIRNYLDKASRISGKSNSHYMSFAILEYLEHFCKNFPTDSCLYLMNVFNSNNLEDLTYSSHHIFAIIEQLFELDLPSYLKDSLTQIIKKCGSNGEPYCKYQGEILVEKYGIK